MEVFRRSFVLDEVAERLLQAARDLVEHQTVDQITVKALADGAGVSTINVYSRFGSKDGVFSMLAQQGLEELRVRFEAVEADDPAGYLRSCVAAYRSFARQNPVVFDLMLGGTGRAFAASADFVGSGQAVLAVLISRLTSFGWDESESPEIVLGSVWGSVHGIVTLELLEVGDAVVDWSTVLDSTLDVLLARLSAERPDRSARPDDHPA